MNPTTVLTRLARKPLTSAFGDKAWFWKVHGFVRASPRDKLWTVLSTLGKPDWYWELSSPGDDRTAYLLGLYGAGRTYIKQLTARHIGTRARYVADTIRLHPGPTSMIYIGHATVKHLNRGHYPPAVTKAILESVRSGFSDLIFIYRHPLDSLLTNWVWWRTYLREKRMISGISVYKNKDDFCAELERNFDEFKSFAEGDLSFFAQTPGQPFISIAEFVESFADLSFFAQTPARPFLSLAEFVEETELFLKCAPLSLRLEDFTTDPGREFSKMLQVMSIDLDLRGLQLPSPTTKPYGHRAVMERVPRFRKFVSGLDTDTRRRIEGMGYPL